MCASVIFLASSVSLFSFFNVSNSSIREAILKRRKIKTKKLDFHLGEQVGLAKLLQKSKEHNSVVDCMFFLLLFSYSFYKALINSLQDRHLYRQSEKKTKKSREHFWVSVFGWCPSYRGACYKRLIALRGREVVVVPRIFLNSFTQFSSWY